MSHDELETHETVAVGGAGGRGRIPRYSHVICKLVQAHDDTLKAHDAAAGGERKG